MKVTVLHVGSSLLAPLRNAEREINRDGIDLRLAVHNFGDVFADDHWKTIESDLGESAIVFVIHVMDGENASRLLPLLDQHRTAATVVVINCMPELMRRTRMGKLDLGKLPRGRDKGETTKVSDSPADEVDSQGLLRAVTSWIGRQARGSQK